MRHVRFNRVEGVFEGRCEACGEWLLLDPELRDDLWPCEARRFRICRACDNLKSRLRMAKRREDPAFREAEKARLREYYRSLSPVERRAMKKSDTERNDTRLARNRVGQAERRLAAGHKPRPVVRPFDANTPFQRTARTGTPSERGHRPVPTIAGDGRYECVRCGWLLRPYVAEGISRMRHYKARAA